MIHYHGTPISPRDQLLRMGGRHFCISIIDPRDLATCIRIGQSVLLDNGAFSHHTRGTRPDWSAFYKWIAPVLGHPHFAVIPDVIDGNEEQQDALLAEWPFRRSLGAPVWHLNETLSRLLSLADRYPRVCFGSSGAFWQIDSPAWRRRMDEAFNALAKSGHGVPWIHGLRMLGQTDGDWPLASADSTNVAQSFKRDTGCAECKAAPIDASQTPLFWNPRPTQQDLLGAVMN